MKPALSFLQKKEFLMSGVSTDQEGQIKELAAKGEKIAAIKLYRETSGVSLNEAKNAVDAIMRGEAVISPVPVQVGDPDPFLENQIKRLLAERKKIEAVRMYREAYRCGLKEAKDAVDLIQAKMRREGYSSTLPTPAISDDPFTEDTQRNRRFLVLAFALMLVVIAGLAFFFLTGNGF
jgi:ribosomal protein L7/L12